MNKKRRNFLKLLFLGSGAFVLGNLLGKLNLNPGIDTGIKEIKNFKIVEDGNKLVFYNKNGRQVFALSEDGTLEVS